jgi:hypothetical protein
MKDRRMRLYKKTGRILARPYEVGEDMNGISVSIRDHGHLAGGWIACDPDNPSDRWFINAEFFEKNYRSARPVRKIRTS